MYLLLASPSVYLKIVLKRGWGLEWNKRAPKIGGQKHVQFNSVSFSTAHKNVYKKISLLWNKTVKKVYLMSGFMPRLHNPVYNCRKKSTSQGLNGQQNKQRGKLLACECEGMDRLIRLSPASLAWWREAQRKSCVTQPSSPAGMSNVRRSQAQRLPPFDRSSLHHLLPLGEDEIWEEEGK